MISLCYSREVVNVVPLAVKIRVSLFIVAGVALAALPWVMLPSIPWLSALWSALILGCGAYAAWCFWPKFTWGFGYNTMAQLPVVPGQRYRLSFDDGPTLGLTDGILDVLAERRVKASFFVLVKKARLQPRLIRRILDDGHVLGLHGEDHRTPFRRGADELQASLAGALAELERIAGQPVTLYRPSHGWKNLALYRALARLPLKVSNWHFGVWDTDAPPADILTARLWSVTPTDDRPSPPIILLHDGLDDDPAVPRHAASLLESLTRWLSATERPVAVPASGWRTWLRRSPALIWIALLVWTARHIAWGPVWQAFADVPIGAAVGVLVVSWLATVFQALRFFFLYPGGLGPVRHVALNFALQAGNVLLPMRSGELLRPFYMKRWNRALPLTELLAWSVVDKIAELIAILPLVLAACVVFANDPRFGLVSRWAWPTTGVVVGVGLLALIVQWRRGTGAGSLRATATQAGVRGVLLSISCSLIGWLCNLWIFYLVVPDLRLSLALLVGVNIAAAIPALPAGLGAFEAAFVWVGRMGGLSPELALALALVSHIVQIVGTLALGVPTLLIWGWPETRAGMQDLQ